MSLSRLIRERCGAHELVAVPREHHVEFASLAKCLPPGAEPVVAQHRAIFSAAFAQIIPGRPDLIEVLYRLDYGQAQAVTIENL
jgi:hypothetical protein